MSEQDQLARLVEERSREPIDSASMLEGFLRSRLSVSSEKLVEVQKEIEASGGYVVGNKLSRTDKQIPTGQLSEQSLIDLYGIREELIGTFESAGLNSNISEKVSSAINKIEKIIKTAGGEIDDFIPLNHFSGLQAPNILKNAEKVIETTIQCYSIGHIDEAKISNGGKTVNIIFSGTQNGTAYKAIGTITTEEWTGNEAIDYIYTPREGKMSVKAYENGRWADRISSGKYKVVWDLEEKPLSKNNNIKEAKEIKTVKEGNVTNTQNNIKESVDSEEEEIGNPIVK